MKKIASRRDSDFFGDFIDFIGDCFTVLLEFISHPKEKPKTVERK
jgi:hypothetical protein